MTKHVNNTPTAQIMYFLFLATCGFLGILEFMAYWKKEIWSITAVYIWIIFGAYFLIFSTYQIVKTFIRDFKMYFIWGFLVLFFFSFLILSFPNISQYINHESTQQAASAFAQFQKKDLNYSGQSFLGYPSRQYLITTLPSFLFGRSPLLLNLGYVIPFIFSLYIFYSGLRTFLGDHRNNAILSTIGIISIFLFTYVFRLIFLFEQSIIPLAITLNAAGWFLITYKKPSLLNFFALLWIGSLLSGIYTPGFASWILLICAGFYQSLIYFKSKNHQLAYAWLSVVLVITIFGALSIWEINNTNPIFTSLKNPDFERENIFAKSIVVLKEGYGILFSTSQNGKNFIQPFIYFPVIIYLISSLFAGNRFRHFFLAVWFLITVGVAVLLKGYASPPPELSIHRALVVIPPLLIGVLSWIENQRIHFNRTFLFIFMITALLLVIVSYLQTIDSTSSKDDLRTYFIIQILNVQQKGKIDTKQHLNILVNSNEKSLISLKDMIEYFIPSYSVTFIQDCSSYDGSVKNTILFSDSVECAKILNNQEIKILPLYEKNTHFYYALSQNN